jgi:hypothetical protein
MTTTFRSGKYVEGIINVLESILKIYIHHAKWIQLGQLFIFFICIVRWYHEITTFLSGNFIALIYDHASYLLFIHNTICLAVQYPWQVIHKSL